MPSKKIDNRNGFDRKQGHQRLTTTIEKNC